MMTSPPHRPFFSFSGFISNKARAWIFNSSYLEVGMSHLFEIESAVFIKPYIFILASEAGRGLSSPSGILCSSFSLEGRQQTWPRSPQSPHSNPTAPGPAPTLLAPTPETMHLKDHYPQNNFLNERPFGPLPPLPSPYISAPPCFQLGGCYQK